MGGGPAGLATAIALRQRGLRCVVVDARDRDSVSNAKACGEGLMPGALAALGQLGIRLAAGDGHRFGGIRFIDGPTHADAFLPAEPGLGLQRGHLHALLAARAEAAGARLLWGSRVTLPAQPGHTHHDVLIDGRPFRFRWLVGADGQSSSVRRWAGLEDGSASLRYGFSTHYPVAPWTDQVEVHWGAIGQLYITPVAPECVCVVFIGHRSEIHRGDPLAAFPAVAARLAGAAPSDPRRGGAGATRRLRRVAAASVALVGDASGSADPITGEGLTVTFEQALALAGSIASGSLAPYRKAHARIGRIPNAVGFLLLLLDRWPTLRRSVLRVFAAVPGVFSSLLAVHLGPGPRQAGQSPTDFRYGGTHRSVSWEQ